MLATRSHKDLGYRIAFHQSGEIKRRLAKFVLYIRICTVLKQLLRDLHESPTRGVVKRRVPKIAFRVNIGTRCH